VHRFEKGKGESRAGPSQDGATGEVPVVGLEVGHEKIGRGEGLLREIREEAKDAAPKWEI
jgi:hypothetical protein